MDEPSHTEFRNPKRQQLQKDYELQRFPISYWKKLQNLEYCQKNEKAAHSGEE